MRRILLGFVSAAVITVAQPASADTVTDWWDFAGDVFAPAQAMAHPPEQDRAVTRVALAMFEALNAIDRRYESYLNLPVAEPGANPDAAAATAAYKVLLEHFPASKAAIEDSYAITMAQIDDGPAKAAGVAIGEQAAEAANKAGGIDPTVVQTPYRPRTTPGEWIGTALPQIEPYMSAFKPWVIESAEALRPPPPPAMNSEVWTRDYEEVRRLGGKTSTERTPHQTIMARYRQAFDLAPTMHALAPRRGQLENARTLALYQMAFDDAALAMIVAKFHYNYWRPITAIRNGEADGNEATAPDPAWTPLLPTPGFPEYPCGHCAVAGAIGEVMKAETGAAPKGGIRVASQAIPTSVVQILPSWDRWVEEVSLSRMYGGVHYRFSNDAGEEIGRKAARAALGKLFRPLPGRTAKR